MNNTWVNYVAVFGIPAYFFNDVLVLISLTGSIVLFLGSFPHSPFKRFIGLAEWHSAPLVFGSLFQLCFMLIGMAPETPKMGLLVPMPPALVNGLFALSFLLLFPRWWVGRNV